MAAKIIPPHISHLAKDEHLRPLVASLDIIPVKKKSNVCLRLCASIISQQLSTRVAEVIFKRFLALYNGEEPTPQQIIDTPFDTLKGIGLSNAKTNYVQNVANYMLEHKADDKMLYKMSNEEVVAFLTPIKGVGRWTVEMLLMFTLGREDVFAVDNLGIQQGMVKLYNLDTTNKKALREEMLRLSEAWIPYRTYACLYIWRYKDKKD